MIAFAFHQATFLRPQGEPLLAGIDWTLHEGEAWAILGPSGSGKTSLLQAIAGTLRQTAGTTEWPDVPAGRICTMVAFREESRSFRSGDYYYQQRYEFAGDSPTLAEYLAGAVPAFGLEPLINQPFVTLSNGQMRKARIAKALAQAPQLLLLDDPFLGLDSASRAELAAKLGELYSQGQRIVLTCRPDDLPAYITHVLHLEGGRITWQGPRSQYPPHPERSETFSPCVSSLGEIIVQCRDVTVRHSGQIILDRVNWTVRRGERWALLGPNGSGKTTLLSLLVGDHPQAFSNDVSLFGQRRGSGETLWDIRRRVGFVSPEFHQYFAEDLTAAEAAETGFHDTLLHMPVSAEQRQQVRSLFAEFGAAFADRRMRQLSMSQQRLALLIRAIVKRPPLVVLDEPYQGLDAGQIGLINDWLVKNLTAEQTLIITTHRIEELPPIITHRLQL